MTPYDEIFSFDEKDDQFMSVEALPALLAAWASLNIMARLAFAGAVSLGSAVP